MGDSRDEMLFVGVFVGLYTWVNKAVRPFFFLYILYINCNNVCSEIFSG